MIGPARPLRRSLLLGAAAALASARTFAQPRPRRVGIAYNNDPDAARPYQEAFAAGMAEHGFRLGRDYVIEARYAQRQNNRYPGVMADLVAANVDAIVAGPNTAVEAARVATTRIPIVMAGTYDPEATGTVASLARPGANVTGVAMHSLGLAGKRLELCRELVPAAKRVGYLYDPLASGAAQVVQALPEAFRALRLDAVLAEAPDGADLDRALATLVDRRSDAVTTSAAIALWSRRQQIADFCTRARLPGVFPYREFADAGGLASYAASLVDTFRMAGTYAARILAGADPATMPVERPTRYELVLNARTAAAIGIALPPSALARADDVIR